MNMHQFNKKKRDQVKMVQQQKKNTNPAVTDNRPQTAMQKKQVAGMNNHNGSAIPVQKKANKTGLPDNLKSGVENLSGISMDDVKVHYGSSKPAKVQAHAYAQGSDIHIAPGQEKHLPHEAWHVAQQKQGRVKPTIQAKGNVKINDDKGLEHEADQMGRKAMQGRFIKPLPMQLKTAFGGTKNAGTTGEKAADDVLQLTRWKWSEKKDKWIDLDDSGEDPPIFDGEVDGEIYDDEPKSKKRKKDPDQTFRGARTFGNSSALAKNKYALSSKKPRVDFKKWRKKKEAQHIIPASIAKKYKSLQGIIDDHENAIMLPATFSPTNTKLTHRKPNYRDHRKYTNNSERLIQEVLQNTNLKNNQSTMKRIMKSLRMVNKLTKHTDKTTKKTENYQYVDDVPYKRYLEMWNFNNPGNQL